jgi:hypothetical protein
MPLAGTTGRGLDRRHRRAVDPALDARVRAELADAIAKVEAIPDPFRDAITTPRRTRRSRRRRPRSARSRPRSTATSPRGVPMTARAARDRVVDPGARGVWSASSPARRRPATPAGPVAGGDTTVVDRTSHAYRNPAPTSTPPPWPATCAGDVAFEATFVTAGRRRSTPGSARSTTTPRAAAATARRPRPAAFGRAGVAGAGAGEPRRPARPSCPAAGAGARASAPSSRTTRVFGVRPRSRDAGVDERPALRRRHPYAAARADARAASGPTARRCPIRRPDARSGRRRRCSASACSRPSRTPI